MMLLLLLLQILGAKLLEQGPVMILTFNAQQLTSDITHAGNVSIISR